MFKNYDIMDNFNIMGSDNMTPIIEKETQFANPYATTLWKSSDENKKTVNKLKTDSRDNLKKTLSTRRNISLKSLHLSNKVNKETVNSASKKKNIASYILEIDESEFFGLPSVSSEYSDSLQPINNFTNDTVFVRKKRICNSAVHNKVESPISLTYLKTTLAQSDSSFKFKAVKDKTDFLSVLEIFTIYEYSYLENLRIVKNCFHHQFSNNMEVKLKLTTTNDIYAGEVLIFGNIETMIDLNVNFLNDVKDCVSSYFNINRYDSQFWFIAKNSLNTKDLNQFGIALILKNAFIKWKQTYKSYIGSHQKQIEYINFLVNNEESQHHMFKWFDLSVSKALTFKKGNETPYKYFLRLLKQPEERLQNWQNFLESLVMMSKNVLSTRNYDMILRLYEDINDFADEIKKEAESFNSTKRLSTTNCLTSLNSVKSKAVPMEIETSNNVFSETSSIYTGYSLQAESELPKGRVGYECLITKTIDKKGVTNKQHLQKLLKNELSTKDNFEVYHYEFIFKNIKLELQNLIKTLEEMSFTGYTNYMKKFVSSWKKVFYTNDNNMDHKIYDMYLQKLEIQSIHIAELENHQLKNLKKSLKSVINYVSFSYKKIEDFIKLLHNQRHVGHNNGNISLYGLKNKGNSLDKSVEQEAIQRHIKYLSYQIKQDVPLLLTTISKFKIEFINQFNTISLEFLKITVGNKNNLEAYIRKHDNQELDFGDNFDIIQQFINNKDKTKEIIKETDKKMYYNSKTFRHLFK